MAGPLAYMTRKANGLCVKCGKVAVSGKDPMCRPCRTKQRKYAADWANTRRENGVCLSCKVRRPSDEHFHCIECRKKNAERCRSYLASLKDLVYDHYGRQCSCCGEREMKFLSVDHKNNDGHVFRKSYRHKNAGTRVYGWVVRNGFPSSIQILCHNCNFGRFLNGGQCPHKSAKDRK